MIISSSMQHLLDKVVLGWYKDPCRGLEKGVMIFYWLKQGPLLNHSQMLGTPVVESGYQSVLLAVGLLSEVHVAPSSL